MPANNAYPILTRWRHVAAMAFILLPLWTIGMAATAQLALPPANLPAVLRPLPDSDVCARERGTTGPPTRGPPSSPSPMPGARSSRSPRRPRG